MRKKIGFHRIYLNVLGKITSPLTGKREDNVHVDDTDHFWFTCRKCHSRLVCRAVSFYYSEEEWYNTVYLENECMRCNVTSMRKMYMDTVKAKLVRDI